MHRQSGLVDKGKILTWDSSKYKCEHSELTWVQKKPNRVLVTNNKLLKPVFEHDKVYSLHWQLFDMTAT